jgi:hypothetical protein
MRRISILAPTLFIAALIASCSEDPAGQITKKEPALVVLEAQLAAPETLAGQPVGVTCIATFDDESTKELAPPDVAIEIAPVVEGAQIVDGRILISRSGTYQISCTNPVASQIKPATLVVRATVPVKTIATLDRETIASGERATAACRLEDSAGNVVENLFGRIEASPADGVTVNGFSIDGIKVGTYQVTCAVDGYPDIEKVPATLNVTAGAPFNVTVVLSDDTVFAGDRVEVTCLVNDAAQNPVMVPTEFTVTPAVMTVDPAGLMPTLAGDYAITCSVPSVNLSSTPPTPLHVAAGLPANIVILELIPQQTVYALSSEIEIRAQVTDAFGNEAPNAIWEATSNPPTATRFAGPHAVDLAAEGLIELVAQVTSPTAAGLPVTASVNVLVDGTPPEVVFDFPERGEIVQGPTGSSMTIVGHVTDLLSPVTSLTIGNTQVPVDAQGGFSATITPNWAINLIEGSAADSAGNVRNFAQSFEYSAQYRQAGDNRIASGRISDGLALYLGQTVLDDNNADVDDLATIARLAIEQADLNALIPDPVTTYNSDCSVWPFTITGALRLWVDDVTFGTPVIDITAINGGIHLRAEIPNLVVDMHTTGDVCDIGVGVSGTASATRAIIEGDILISRSGTNIVVTMASPSVSLSGLNINLNLPSIIDWAVDGIINLFEGMIEDRLEDALQDTIQDAVPPVVDDFLSAIALGTSLNLPAPLSLALGVDARLGMLDFDAGHGELGFDSTIYATGMISPEPLGGILQDSRPWPAFSGARAFGVGVAYDLINQALYSTWYGGGLDIDLAQFIPGSFDNNGNPATIQAAAHAMLPPVFVPTTDPQYPVELQVGDLELTVVVDGVPNLPAINATIYATVYAQANATINAQQQIVLTLAPNPYISLDFMSNIPGLDVAAFTTSLEQTMQQFIPQLFSQVVGGIPIPSFDLSAIAGNFLPAGIVLGIGNASTAYHPSYLVLEGDIVQLP